MALTERAEQISEFYSRVVDNSHNWNDGFLTFGEWKTKSGDPIPHPLCYEAVYDELLEGKITGRKNGFTRVAKLQQMCSKYHICTILRKSKD